MSDYPTKLSGFVIRQPDDDIDIKLLRDVREHGWHVIGVPDDEEGPGFAFTVGIYLRTLQPEILIMGIPFEPSLRILNAIAAYLMAGGTLMPDTRYPEFVDGRDVLFRPIHETRFREYLGCANWSYRPLGVQFPALQCVWPDLQGHFPHETGFDSRLVGKQVDLSLPSA